MRNKWQWMCAALACSAAFGQTCDLKAYKAQDGLKAAARNASLELNWNGERNQELRAVLAIVSGQPVVKELAARKASGEWVILGQNLTPEYQTTSGKRRLSQQQIAPLKDLKVELTPEVIEREKWNAFWDAPLMVPGGSGTNLDLPRKPEEIQRAWATYQATGCSVNTEGARLEVTFPGVKMGIFSGDLRYTVYRGSNLLRQEVIARTDAHSVAYKYIGGLKGFSIADDSKLVWRDVARNWQQYGFGGAVNQDAVGVRARNRLALLESRGGTLAVFPAPHKFFFAREIETNLGYVYYRKDSEGSFALGVRQADREEPYRPYGVSNAVWDRRANEAHHHTNNFALYNAPPGTWQHMPVYFYLSAEGSRPTADAILAYTHEDRYPDVPGFKKMVSHFHMHYNEMLTDAGTIDVQPSWLQVFRGLGINIVLLADFHSDSHPKDPGPLRLPEQKVYFDGCRRFSDRDFLLIPGEEPNAYFGGHYITFMPRPVYWTQVRSMGQPAMENNATYGKVYHIGSAGDELEMLKSEGGLFWQAHPRTKGSTGYPDATRETTHIRSEQFLGGSYQSLPVDQSEPRICEKRCLGLLDDMNNWGSPRYMLAEGDTYMKYPDDETYPQLIVNYVKLDRVPKFDEDWSSIAKRLRSGDYFISTGEVVFKNWGVEKGAYTADVEWTYPLEFVELVWGDGAQTGRQVVKATDLPAFGKKQFRIPFDPAGKKWIRFAVWDSAGNGAFTQPVHLH